MHSGIRIDNITVCSLLIPCRFIFRECHRSNRARGSSTGTDTPYHYSAGCGGYSGGDYCLCETERVVKHMLCLILQPS